MEKGKVKRKERYNREGGKLVSRQDWGNDEKLKLEKVRKKKEERKEKGNKAGKTKERKFNEGQGEGEARRTRGKRHFFISTAEA
jgi:hypothetical protein